MGQALVMHRVALMATEDMWVPSASASTRVLLLTIDRYPEAVEGALAA